jgi:hypothetical protein
MVVGKPDIAAGRHLDHHRPSAQIEGSRPVGRVRIQREADLERTGGSDAHGLVIPNAGGAIAVEDALDRNRRIPEPIGRDRALEIGVVTSAVSGVG